MPRFLLPQFLELADNASIAWLRDRAILKAELPMDLDTNMSKNVPKISVVIPTYNMAKFLPQVLSSILRQDYPNTEVIIVDGLSTDDTPKVIETYSDIVTKFISEKDNGQPEAATKGLRMATGDIVHWQAADDIILPGAFHRIAEEFHRDPSIDLVYTDGIGFRDRSVGKQQTARFVNFEDALLFFGRFQSDGAYWRREITEQALPMDDEMHLTVDEDFFLRLWVGHKFKWVGQDMGGFRSHGDQVSQRVDRSQVGAQREGTRKKIFDILGWDGEEVARRRARRKWKYLLLNRFPKRAYHACRFILRRISFDIVRKRYEKWFFNEWLKPVR
jgi:glycosyltransferase involved in cell wall biosynthesis